MVGIRIQLMNLKKRKLLLVEYILKEGIPISLMYLKRGDSYQFNVFIKGTRTLFYIFVLCFILSIKPNS